MSCKKTVRVLVQTTNEDGTIEANEAIGVRFVGCIEMANGTIWTTSVGCLVHVGNLAQEGYRILVGQQQTAMQMDPKMTAFVTSLLFSPRCRQCKGHGYVVGKVCEPCHGSGFSDWKE